MDFKSNDDKNKNLIDSPKAWMMWSIGALFYFFQFILRVSPNVMTEELMSSFAVDACALGVLSSYWYFSYSSLQIPIGASMDIFGPRKMLTVAGLMCSLGIFIFTTTDQLMLASLGRLLIGAGSACGYLGTLKLGSQWFSPSKFALVVGCTLVFGKTGAVVGGKPLALLVDDLGWRTAMMMFMGVGLSLSFLSWTFLRDTPAGKLPHLTKKNLHITHHLKDMIKEVSLGLKHIATTPQVWILAIYGCLMYVPLSAFADLWGTPYLMEKFQLPKTDAAQYVSLIYIGMGLGSPCFAIFSEKFKSRKNLMVLSALSTLAAHLSVFFVPMSLELLGVALFFSGFLLGGQPLMFASCSELMPKSINGTTIGFANMIVMLSGVVLQPMFGYLMNYHRDGAFKATGNSIYTLPDYEFAVICIPVSLILAALMVGTIKDTYPKESTESNA